MKQKITLLTTTILLGMTLVFCGCGGGGSGGDEDEAAPVDVSGYWNAVLDFGSGYTADYYFFDLQQSGTTVTGEFSDAYDLTGSYENGSIQMNVYDPFGNVEYTFQGTVSGDSMYGTAVSYIGTSTSPTFTISWTASK